MRQYDAHSAPGCDATVQNTCTLCESFQASRKCCCYHQGWRGWYMDEWPRGCIIQDELDPRTHQSGWPWSISYHLFLDDILVLILGSYSGSYPWVLTRLILGSYPGTFPWLLTRCPPLVPILVLILGSSFCSHSWFLSLFSSLLLCPWFISLFSPLVPVLIFILALSPVLVLILGSCPCSHLWFLSLFSFL